mgnify:CR=1 FL=1
MKKPNSLRAALKAALDPRHALATDPDNLQLVITELHPACSAAPGRSFENRYKLELTFLGFAGDVLEIQIPLMVWLERWQSELLASPEASAAGIQITAIPHTDDTSDIMIVLKLSERVAFRPRPGGGYDVAYAEEPMPFALDDVDAEPLHAVYLDGAQILHCEAHPAAGV